MDSPQKKWSCVRAPKGISNSASSALARLQCGQELNEKTMTRPIGAAAAGGGGGGSRHQRHSLDVHAGRTLEI